MRQIVFLFALLFAGLQTFAQTYTYDNLNRLTKVVYENGTTVTYTYDALGNRTKKKVTSNSVADEFTVSVTALPVQGGTVSGGGTYASGTVIELLATPNAGYEFVEWSDGVTANPRTVTVTSDMNFTAQFLATGFTTDYAQKVILYMRNNRVYEYGVPELTDISFNDRKQQLTVNKTNNQQDEYSVLLLDSIAFVDGISGDNERHQFFCYDINGIRYALYKKPNLEVQQPNADGWSFYKSELTLDVTKNGTTTSYVVDDNLYLAEETNNDVYPLCMAIDLNSRMLYIFSNSKTLSRNYSMDGYAYVSSLDNISFQKETVFSNKNWGWTPYFIYENNSLTIRHFSYAGYYAMSSTRTGSGSWDTQSIGSISPDAFAAQKKANGFVLVIGTDAGVDNNDHEYVDLGLPSGTLWATCNVGASSPEEPGDLYAWGETETKTEYSWSTYKWCDGDACNASNHTLTKYCDRGGYGPLDGKISIEPEDDVAHVKWGGKWHMPTKAQFQELFENCTAEWIKLSDNLHAYKFTAPNGNSITMPAAGEYSKSNFSSDDFYYWSSELNMRDNPANNHGTHCVAIEYDSNTMPGFVGLLRYCGYAVRPVLSDYTPIVHQVQAPTSYLSHNLVDLGLPSGTLWATCNLGASSPEGYGCYYAWGETTGSCEGKTSFKDQTYQYYNGSIYTKYNSTDNLIDLEKSDDAAFAKWGGEWRMPTWSEMSELKNTKYTTWEWTSVGGINGLRVTSVVKGFEGNSIFLPAGGEHDASKVNSLGDYGYYWSSHLDTDSETSSSACYLFVKSSGWGSGYTSRSMGRSVRPVVSLDDISQ